MFARVLFILLILWLTGASAQERVSIAYPGPLTVPFLPLDLAIKIGADKAEGIELVPQYGSGAISLQHLHNRNADFAVPGGPAAMAAKAAGNDVVVIAALNDLPVYALMVRNELKGKVRRPRDLAGRVVGVTTSSMSVKTTSHQIAELLLRNDGVSPKQIRIAAAGQTWAEIRAAVDSQSIDALLAFEPFPSRLRDEGLMYYLVDLSNAAEVKSYPGAGFLLAALVTRTDVIAADPKRVERVVACIRRALAWMSTHTPEQIVAALDVADETLRMALVRTLRQYPRLYTPDGKFSARQIRETNTFYAAAADSKAKVSFKDIIDDRWVGQKP
jgi:NitT/TauT family transport system substrate-binding protein